jgi:hypothetical protein
MALNASTNAINNSRYAPAGSFDTAGGQRRYGFPFYQSPPGAYQNMAGSWYNVPGGWLLDRVYGWYRVTQPQTRSGGHATTRAGDSSVRSGGCCGKQQTVVINADAGSDFNVFTPVDKLGADDPRFMPLGAPQGQPSTPLGDFLRDLFKPRDIQMPDTNAPIIQTSASDSGMLREIIAGVVTAVVVAGLGYAWHRYGKG